jgi:GrpB-like predicted nucleotidyltransferase (UPF0157 family)
MPVPRVAAAAQAIGPRYQEMAAAPRGHLVNRIALQDFVTLVAQLTQAATHLHDNGMKAACRDLILGARWRDHSQDDMGVEPRPSLSERLWRAGIPPDADPVARWVRLHQVEGRRATVIDLYQLVGEPRGLKPHELPLEERKRLARVIAPTVWPGFEVTDDSERFDPINVVTYDKEWPASFASWRGLIANELGPVALRIDHVGSTSVRGLAAKPIVDVQVSVADMADEEAYVPQLERLGVQLRSRDRLHRYFRPFVDRPRNVHVHVCPVASEWEREHLLLRDFLRASPAARDVYAEAKREASRVWADDGWAYTDAKSDAILSILEDAEHWALDTTWTP